MEKFKKIKKWNVILLSILLITLAFCVLEKIIYYCNHPLEKKSIFVTDGFILDAQGNLRTVEIQVNKVKGHYIYGNKYRDDYLKGDILINGVSINPDDSGRSYFYFIGLDRKEFQYHTLRRGSESRVDDFKIAKDWSKGLICAIWEEEVETEDFVLVFPADTEAEAIRMVTEEKEWLVECGWEGTIP